MKTDDLSAALTRLAAEAKRIDREVTDPRDRATLVQDIDAMARRLSVIKGSRHSEGGIFADLFQIQTPFTRGRRRR